MSQPKSIVITGASGGIGQAIAEAFAAPDVVMLLAGRDLERLNTTKTTVEAKGATAKLLTVPLSAHVAFCDGLRAFDAEHPVDLLIANAGVKTGNENGVEIDRETERIIDVNLKGTLRTVQALLPAMQARRSGQIALVGSLSAISPHADLLSYTATKAGIHAYSAALRRSLIGSGVSVSTIIPGFVKTAMTDRHLGPTPLAISPKKAGHIIHRGLLRKKSIIAFPRALIWLACLGYVLPIPIRDRVENLFRAEVLPDQDEIDAQKLTDRD